MRLLGGADTIRTLVSILISLLVALALGAALYALVLAVGRDPLPGAEQRFAAAPPLQLAAPSRLAPVPGIQTSDMSSPERHRAGQQVTVPIQVAGPAPLLRGPDAGVATFHTVTGGDFRWYPLDEALPGQDGAALVTARATLGERITVALAASRAHARHGYIHRRVLEVAAAPGSRTTEIVEIDGAVHAVRFDLPDGVEQAGPLRLQRVDDRQWLPMLHTTAGLKLRRGVDLTLQLGAGTYELQDALDAARMQRFDVPGTAAVTVTTALPPARGDRR